MEALRGGSHALLNAMPAREGNVNILAHKRANKGIIISMDVTDFCDLLLYQAKDASKKHLPGWGALG